LARCAQTSGEQVDDTQADEEQQQQRQRHGGRYLASDASENADIDTEAERRH
jgi:hypothetical protein